jgi:hypothetical protein
MPLKKNYVATARRYAEAVVSGKIDACGRVCKACRRQLDDLKRWKTAGPYRFDAKKANRICQFVEGFHHIKGEWARRRERIRLEPWQCFIYTAVFGWVSRETDCRRFRTAYIEIPRKNAKSTMSAPVGISLAFRQPQYCPYTGIQLTPSNSHVDHCAPATFHALAGQWLERQGISMADIHVAPNADNQWACEMADQRQKELWQSFHHDHAILRIISRRANLSYARLK